MLLPQSRQFLWPTTPLKDCGSYPHRLDGAYEKKSYFYQCRPMPLLSSITRHWFLGASYDCPRQVPGAWSHHQRLRMAGFRCKSVAFYRLAVSMSRNSACVPRGGLAPPSAHRWGFCSLNYRGGPYRRRP